MIDGVLLTPLGAGQSRQGVFCELRFSAKPEAAALDEWQRAFIALHFLMSMSDSKRSGSGNLQTASEMPESPLLGPELDIEQQPVGGEWLPNSGVGISEFGLFWFLLHAFCLRCSGYSTPDKPQTSRWRHFPWVANAMLWGFIAFELYLFIPFSLESARSIMDTSVSLHR